MKTTLDLPRPLLLRIVARAARMRIPISRYIAETLEQTIPRESPKPDLSTEETKDPLFDAFREELGL
ncbi:hypothetical protein [Haloferula sp.]|uniref:hypothetical protein n=1 Tax=Haloferula sp. TaxID=2497595 RepID=UPI003C707145